MDFFPSMSQGSRHLADMDLRASRRRETRGCNDANPPCHGRIRSRIRSRCICHCHTFTHAQARSSEKSIDEGRSPFVRSRPQESCCQTKNSDRRDKPPNLVPPQEFQQSFFEVFVHRFVIFKSGPKGVRLDRFETGRP